MCAIVSQISEDHSKALKYAKTAIKYIHQVINDTYLISQYLLSKFVDNSKDSSSNQTPREVINKNIDGDDKLCDTLPNIVYGAEVQPLNKLIIPSQNISGLNERQ